MRQHLPDIVLRLELADALQTPAGRLPRVVMQEIAPLGPLVVVHVDAELDVPARLLHPLVELGEPGGRISVHVLIQLL